MVLDNYIKQDFVKQVFMKSCLFVSDIQQAELLAHVQFNHRRNIIFETSYMKCAFFNKLKLYHPQVRVISCDSSQSRLLQEIEINKEYPIVFDKVNYLEDVGIFNKINKMNRILVC